MKPIEKNIIVVDELGNEYEATYYKRAKGLVNKGRARFINENTICLACPPNINLEDLKMNEDTFSNEINQDQAAETAQKPVLTMEYVLSRIDMIINDNAHIHDAIQAVREMAANNGLNNHGDRARGSEAIAHAVQCRETTNQQALRILEKMYDNLSNNKREAPDEMSKFRQLVDILKDYPPELATGVIRKTAQQMFVKPGTNVIM